MAESKSLRLQDMRAITRIAGECRDLGHTSSLWLSHLSQEAAKLVDAPFCSLNEDTPGLNTPPANLAFVNWGWHNGFDEDPFPELWTKFMTVGAHFNPMYAPYKRIQADNPGIGLTNSDLLTENEWVRSEYFDKYHSQMGSGPALYSYTPASGGRDTGIHFTIVRHLGGHDFSTRAKTVLQALGLAVGDLLGGPLASAADHSPDKLPRRCQHVLACLLEGDGDKQIAARLGISRFTVNQYTKSIYTHFAVSGRTELMARWIQRGWSLPRPHSDPLL